MNAPAASSLRETAIVFAGPSVSWPVRPRPGLEFRPPARAGDIYRATLDMPAAIGIIDGYFGAVPAVRHKEILWALALGIPVFGASSIGALRALELRYFGMVGVGRIFQMLLDGMIEDDDEVAIVHAPAELRFAPLSVPMVEVRLTLERAAAAGLLLDHQTSELCAVMKRHFYPLRTHRALLEAANAMGLGAGFEPWITANWVGQKAADAAVLVDRLEKLVSLPQRPQPALRPFEFRRTTFWERARFEATQEMSPNGASRSPLIRHALNELRLDLPHFLRIRSEVELRLLALRNGNLRMCDSGGPVRTPDTLPATGPVRAAMQHWSAANFALDDARKAAAYEVVAAIPSYLIATGAFAELRQRIDRRSAIMSAGSRSEQALSAQKADDATVLRWFLQRNKAPAALSWDELSAMLFLHDTEECRQLVRADHVFVHLSTLQP